jgi:hypothetical protein
MRAGWGDIFSALGGRMDQKSLKQFTTLFGR